jgi:type IV pilus assembly protein PilQ
VKNKMKKIVVFLLLSLSFSVSAQEANEEQVYDFNFVNADFHAVFKSLSVTAGVDILTSPEVQGFVNARITQKTWQEALDIVANLYDLKWVVKDKYIMIMRRSVYEKRKLELAQKAAAEKEIAPFMRHTFSIKHAKAVDLKDVIKTMSSSGGKFSIEERTNSIIVFDTKEQIIEMAEALKELDRETMQVVITARLVVVDATLKRELGVDWSTTLGQGGVTSALNGAVPEGSLYSSRNQMAITSTPRGAAGFSNVATSISMGVLDNQLGLTINQFLSEGKTEILANPQITTLDHSEAELFMGKEVSIRVMDDNGQAANQLIEAGIRLKVIPHITGDRRILLELNPENNSFSIDETGQPILSKQTAETKVVVADGETVVIGGLAQNKEDEVESGVPFLKDIPILGNLFKHVRKEIVKNDLVIFVTPHIVKNDAFASQTAGARMEENVAIQPTPVLTQTQALPAETPQGEAVVPVE